MFVLLLYCQDKRTAEPHLAPYTRGLQAGRIDTFFTIQPPTVPPWTGGGRSLRHSSAAIVGGLPWMGEV